MSDTQLISRAQARDDSAWESIVRLHQERVFRLAYLITGDAEEAKDVAQEAFIQVYRNLHKFNVEKPLRPWLLAITSNIARNKNRSLFRYGTALRKVFSLELIRSSGGIRPAEHIPEADMMWQTIRKLKLSDQHIIYLRYYLELSEAETATTLNIPLGTVKSRLHRALKHLKEIYPIENEGMLNGSSNR